jgi:hypothetical protein
MAQELVFGHSDDVTQIPGSFVSIAHGRIGKVRDPAAKHGLHLAAAERMNGAPLPKNNYTRASEQPEE